MKTKKVFNTIKEYLMITIGILLFVIGWITFLVPNNLIGGGVTGISSIIQYATGGFIKIGTSYFVLNALLLVAALFTLGSNFGGKTVYAIILASVGLNVLQGMIPEEIIQSLALNNGKLMCTIMGAIMVGIGIGITMMNGGSTGGTDIIALIVNKYRNVSPGRMILVLDVVIILSSLLFPSYTKTGELVPFADKVTTVVYGFILVVINSTTLDLVLTGSRKSVQIFIFSKKYEEIADMISGEMHRGVTILDGTGWYTKEPTKVIVVVTRKTDLNLYLKAIKSVDPTAFLSVASVTGVYGKGFDSIKISPAKLKEFTEQRKKGHTEE